MLTRSGLASRWRGFAGDRRGAVAIISAFAMLVVLACAAIAVDVASFYFVKRRLQGTADLAAMAAANDVAHAETAARASLIANGFPPEALISVSTGTYSADAALAPGARYVPGTFLSGNAAHVRLRTEAPHYFSATLFGSSSRAASPTAGGSSVGASGALDTTAIEASATATRPVIVSFAIGSRLIKLDGGLLNALLSALIGSNVGLTAVDYQSLADAQIDLFQFSNALATRTSLTALTYDGLANSYFKAGDVFAAMVDAERAAPGSNTTALNALLRIADLQKGSTNQLSLNPLIDFGPLGSMPGTWASTSTASGGRPRRSASSR